MSVSDAVIGGWVQEAITSAPDKWTIETRSRRYNIRSTTPHRHVDNIFFYIPKLFPGSFSSVRGGGGGGRKEEEESTLLSLRPFKTAAQTVDDVK